MKKFILLSLVLLPLFINGAMAQRYSVKGKIIDNITKENLMFVNCVLYKDSDSTNMYKGVSADTSGNFVIKGVKKDNLNLEFSFVGYEKHNLKIGIDKFKEAVSRVHASKLKEVYISDTIPHLELMNDEKIRIVSLAPLFASIIHKVYNYESISPVFER